MAMPLAVLIDAENVPAKHFGAIRETAYVHGNPIIWTLFGDFFSADFEWRDVAREGGIDVRHQFHEGKNSADMAMTIFAMDLLSAGNVEGICLVSSDSDFVPLARRLRASNVAVYGFGEEKAAAAFRIACTSFHELRDLEAQKPAKRGEEHAKKLRKLLAAACAGEGKPRRIFASDFGQYLRAKAPDLADLYCGKSNLVGLLVDLGVANTHGTGSTVMLSVRFKRALA